MTTTTEALAALDECLAKLGEAVQNPCPTISRVDVYKTVDFSVDCASLIRTHGPAIREALQGCRSNESEPFGHAYRVVTDTTRDLPWREGDAVFVIGPAPPHAASLKTGCIQYLNVYTKPAPPTAAEGE